MHRLFAVFKREYFQAVRKKSFLIMTILGPFLMAAMMFVPALVAMKGIGEKLVAVIDGTGRLSDIVRNAGREPAEPPVDIQTINKAAEEATNATRDPAAALKNNRRGALGRLAFEYVAANDLNDPARSAAAAPPTSQPDTVAKPRDLKAIAQPYLERLRGTEGTKGSRLDGVLVIPRDVFEEPKARMTYYSRSSTDLVVQERLSQAVSRGVSKKRLEARGIDPDEVDRLVKGVGIDGVQVTREGLEKTGGEMNFLFGLLFVILIFMPAMLYGQEIMRGIVQEKTERIVEILISSMSPMELLSGKILGLAAVGLTQLAVWGLMGGVLVATLGAMASAAGLQVGRFIRPAGLGAFLLFYLLGYLIYVCIYAVGGSLVNSEKEAQNFLGPIVLVLMVPWMLAMPVILNPDSTLAVVLSLIPIYTPITMYIRILVSEPPVWQIALSIALSFGTIVGFFWMTAKIFRLGILSYGKRPTIPELWRWLRVA